MEAALIAGLGAFLGHLYPVWLKFKGGKGVATYLGVLLGLAPIIVLVFAAVWLGMAKLFRYSSLAALVAVALAPGYAQALDYFFPHMTDLGEPIAYGQLAEIAVAVAVLVWSRHLGNPLRVAARTEPKIGAKRPAADANGG